MEFVDLESELSVVVQDTINVIGTTINTSVTIYFIFIIKFMDIMFNTENSSTTVIKNFKNMKDTSLYTMDANASKKSLNVIDANVSKKSLIVIDANASKKSLIVTDMNASKKNLAFDSKNDSK